jgi:DNA-binding CsgD family transcriptional regulator
MSTAPSIVTETHLHIEAPEPRLRGMGQPRPTPAELKVVGLRAAGLPMREVADALDLSIHTVVTHMTNINRKMGWTSIVELTHFALAHGLVENKFSPPKKKGKVETFFENNLGRKYSIGDLVRLFGPSVAETISKINRNDLVKVTILLKDDERATAKYYWAIER